MKLFFLLMALLFSIFYFTDSLGEEANSYKPTIPPANWPEDIQPTQAEIGIYLFDIGKINFVQGTYEMLFYMRTICSTNCDNLHFEIMNGRIESKELYVYKPNYRIYRVEALLSDDFDFHRYPFEAHRLRILIEDKYHTVDKLKLRIDESYSGIDKSVRLMGWHNKPEWNSKVSLHYYPHYQQPYMQYSYSVIVNRPTLAGIFKDMMPAIFIMLIGFLTLFLDTYKAINGLAMASGALVSLILLHLSSTADIVASDYMTYFDAFMVVNYFGLLMILSILITIMNSPRFHASYILHQKSHFIVPSIWLLLQTTFFLIYFVL